MPKKTHYLRFDPAAASGGSGWFRFNPETRLGWSFEETVARIHGVAGHDQDLFHDTEKTAFNACGYIDEARFNICDWREDRLIHVFFPVGERPKKLTQGRFIAALKEVLANSIPKSFEVEYENSGDVLSWPPTLSKHDAVAMAISALTGFLSIDDWSDESIAPKKIVEDARKARKALAEAF